MSDDNNNNDDGKKPEKDDYEVGYGKPPKSKRFGEKDGNPINKKGAPTKEQKIIWTRFSHEVMRLAFLNAGQETLTVHDSDGNKIKIPKIEALPKTVINEALKGNMRAVDLYMRYVDRFVKIQDEQFYELQDLARKAEEGRFQASLNPGSREHYEAMYNYFMYRRTMRKIEGDRVWIYLDDEPITQEDWKVFMEYYEASKSQEVKNTAWPPPYPTHLEEERVANMTYEEILRETYEFFKKRKEMRANGKIGKRKFMIEEPRDDRDWEHYERHVKEKLEGKKNPAPWPPAYWDEEYDEDGNPITEE